MSRRLMREAFTRFFRLTAPRLLAAGHRSNAAAAMPDADVYNNAAWRSMRGCADAGRRPCAARAKRTPISAHATLLKYDAAMLMAKKIAGILFFGQQAARGMRGRLYRHTARYRDSSAF